MPLPFAITGITGNVGGALARTLLDANLSVRAVVRDAAKAREWAARGCDVAVAGMTDAAALAAAFDGTAGVFVLPPPEFDPAPGFPEACAVIDALVAALERARPPKVVCLSTIGAQAAETNLLTQRTLLERALPALDLPVAFLRPAWFIENYAWDVASARNGVVDSYLQPLDRPVPMVATADVGRVAAELLQQSWTGMRVVELEGPRRVAPLDAAAAFARILGHAVDVRAVPRASWQALFVAQDMRNPQPRLRMLDGFNEGWIAFEGEASTVRKGTTDLDAVLRGLVARAA